MVKLDLVALSSADETKAFVDCQCLRNERKSLANLIIIVNRDGNKQTFVSSRVKIFFVGVEKWGLTQWNA